MLHWPRGISRARPTRERSMTAEEQTLRTVGFACTVSASYDAASEGMTPIANVCHVCGPRQGRVLAVMMPSVSTSPFQHSGAAVHRAPAPATDAAGQWLTVVATPNVSIAPAAPVLVVVPVVPEVPVAAVLPPGASSRMPTINAAITTSTRPPPTTAATPRGRQRWVTAAPSDRCSGGRVSAAYPADANLADGSVPAGPGPAGYGPVGYGLAGYGPAGDGPAADRT